MSNASKSFTSMQATRSHRRDVNGMVGQWSTFNQMRTFLREICVPLQPADPLKSTASAALQNGLMFQPHSESLVIETSNHHREYLHAFLSLLVPTFSTLAATIVFHS